MANNTAIINGIEYRLIATGEAKVRATLARVKSSADQTAASTAKTGSAFARLAKSLLPAVSAAIALRRAFNLVKTAYNEAVEGTKAMDMMTATLNATGKSAIYTTEELAKMADELQWVSNFSDDDIMSGAITSLLRYNDVSKDIFKRSVQLTADMAAGTKDLSGAAKTLGLSLDDPILGMSRLRRASVSFTETQQEMITALVESGKKAEAQEIILTALESKYAGAAAAAMTASEQMKKAWSEYLQAMGEKTKPVLDGVMDGIAQFLVVITNGVNNSAKKTEDKILAVYNSISRNTYDFLVGAEMNFRLFIQALQTPFEFLKTVFETTLNGFLMGIKKIWAGFTKLPVGVFKSIFNFDLGPLLTAFDAVGEAGKKNGEKVKDAWSDLGGHFAEFGTIWDGYQSKISQFVAKKALFDAPTTADEIIGGGAGAGGDGGKQVVEDIKKEITAAERRIARVKALAESVADIRGKLRGVWDEMLAGQARYYDDVTFADKGYYGWKKRQIEDEVRQMVAAGSLTARQAKIWSEERIKALQAEQQAYADNLTGQAEAADKIAQQQQTIKDSIGDAVSITLRGFSQLITSGKSMAETLKDVFKGWVDFAINEINKLLAKLAIQSIFNIIKTITAGPAAAIGGTTADALIPPGGGIPAPTIFTAGGGRYGNDIPAPTGTNTMMAVINELRQLRRDVYAAQPSAVQLNIRKGELSYAVDRDRKYRSML